MDCFYYGHGYLFRIIRKTKNLDNKITFNNKLVVTKIYSTAIAANQSI